MICPVGQVLARLLFLKIKFRVHIMFIHISRFGVIPKNHQPDKASYHGPVTSYRQQC